MPIGLWPDVTYETEEIAFNPGDRIYLYSDGIPECFSPTMEAYSQERLIDRLKEWRRLPLQETVSALEQDLKTWRGKDEFSDDLTLLAIEMV